MSQPLSVKEKRVFSFPQMALVFPGNHCGEREERKRRQRFMSEGKFLITQTHKPICRSDSGEGIR